MLVFTGDSVIAPFPPYSFNNLALLQYSEPILYSFTLPGYDVEHADFYYYYTTDCVAYNDMIAIKVARYGRQLVSQRTDPFAKL